MIEHIVKTILPPIIGILELMGIFVVAWTGCRGFWDYLQNTSGRKTVRFNTTWPRACPPPWLLKWPQKF